MNIPTTAHRWSTGRALSLSVFTALLGYLAGTRLPLHNAKATTLAPKPAPVHLSEATEVLAGRPSSADIPKSETGLELSEPRGRLTPALERRWADQLERLATRDPQAALAVAQTQKNRRLREQLRAAVLRGWASSAPQAASEWALTLPEDQRVGAVAAVFSGGAVHDVQETVRLAAQLCAKDPARAADYSSALLGTLTEVGEYSQAINFVTTSPTTPWRLEQLNATFEAWAQYQPEEAAAAVASIADPTLKAEAFRGLSTGWAEADPISLANYAVNLPPGETRAQALANALPRWVKEDPVSATAWIAANDSNPDFDMGVAAVATVPDLLAGKPQTALELAQSITDLPLRTNTLRTLTLKWAERDPSSAVRYVENSAAFSLEERVLLLGELRASSASSKAMGE